MHDWSTSPCHELHAHHCFSEFRNIFLICFGSIFPFRVTITSVHSLTRAKLKVYPTTWVHLLFNWTYSHKFNSAIIFCSTSTRPSLFRCEGRWIKSQIELKKICSLIGNVRLGTDALPSSSTPKQRDLKVEICPGAKNNCYGWRSCPSVFQAW